MYNATPVSTMVTTEASHADAKYTVADILSSMANGEPVSSYSDAASFTFTGTATTPTLTPTTLASIEQTFIELQSVPVHHHTQQQDLSRQSGFVPPVVDPVAFTSNAAASNVSMMGIKTEQYHSDYASYPGSLSGDGDDSDTDWEPSPKQARTTHNHVTPYGTNTTSTGKTGGPRRHTGPRRRYKDDQMTPEERAKRHLRRERNKLAAAKCRQRRVDHTNELVDETESLEEVKTSLENEIASLQQQKEQLEFLLQAHKPLCNAAIQGVVVKSEPSETEQRSVSPSTSTARPTSLALPLPVSTMLPSSGTTTTTTASAATGIAISTPSNGVFCTMSLDMIAGGHTGLTPLTGQTGLTPLLSGHTGLTPLTITPENCSTAQRNSSDSSPGGDLSSPTTLMAL